MGEENRRRRKGSEERQRSERVSESREVHSAAFLIDRVCVHV